MLSHTLEDGVLVLTPQDDPGGEAQDTLTALISDLVQVHAPTPGVIVLGAGATAPVINAVVGAHRMCRSLGVLLSVATPCASARRRLQAATAQGGGLVVHARTETAIATACAATA